MYYTLIMERKPESTEQNKKERTGWDDLPEQNKRERTGWDDLAAGPQIEQYGDDMWSLQQFDERRTASHNDAIKHLNYLNDLARKYGTRPFTPRNFWTSQNQRQTPAMSSHMSYDRHVFESFYTHAFGKESVDRIRRKHERNSYW